MLAPSVHTFFQPLFSGSFVCGYMQGDHLQLIHREGIVASVFCAWLRNLSFPCQLLCVQVYAKVDESILPVVVVGCCTVVSRRRVSIGSDSRRTKHGSSLKSSVAKNRDSSVDVDSSVDHDAASVDNENDYVDYYTIIMDAMYRALPILDPSEIPGYEGLPAETKAFACAMFHVRARIYILLSCT